MDSKTLFTFTEFVYGKITIKSTNKPDTKIYCGDNGTQMTVRSGDTLIFVNEEKGIICENVPVFDWDWNGSRQDVPTEITMTGPVFIGKKE